MKKDDFRIIHKSAPIINGPYAYNSDLPADLKAAIAKAFIGRADQGQGRVRPPVRRSEEGLQRRDHQGLGRHHRTDQVRRRAAQEEGVLIDQLDTSEAGSDVTRPFSLNCTRQSRDRMAPGRIHPPRSRSSRCSTRPIARRSRASGCGCAGGGGYSSPRSSSRRSARRSISRTFFSKIGNFVSYFDRILTLDRRRAGLDRSRPNGSGAGANGCGCSARPF